MAALRKHTNNIGLTSGADRLRLDGKRKKISLTRFKKPVYNLRLS